ncbi:Uma2 family endonuclease [Streptosporangium amethystogenes subsp. fukuiense]|uniref:Uma2 family endonuclease n=1 Tax=Streptosporangium amethystogenes subsp. fukuiense TaxID=698418 RepID=A0ABW2SYV0_9ACTN
MTESSLPDWAFPPPEGFVAEDLDRIPQLPAHTELIDGSLVFVSSQASFHTRAADLLVPALRRAAPADLRARREMSVVLGKQQRPEPDMSVIRASAEHSPEQTYYRAEDVVLAVEVISPDSERRDRDRKPTLYAEAGIAHFWLVENQSGRPAVYVYELDPVARSYVLTGIHHDRLKISAPFDIDIDLTEIDKL